MLWPLALKAACERLNNISINEDGESPHSRMSKADNIIIMKQDYHIWGCPVYILDEKLQSGSIGPPKWEPRSRLGIYVGHSPVHAGSVALVLNVTTGHISPQYHVALDDDFSTVPALRDGTSPTHWKELARDNSEKVTDASYDLAKIWIENSKDKISDDATHTTERGSIEQHQGQDKSNTILAIWSFKRKRFLDGSLNKHKARLCAHGGMQQWGVNYWETYSPVVNWISVRLLLPIAIMNDLPTTAIDFALAFLKLL